MLIKRLFFRIKTLNNDINSCKLFCVAEKKTCCDMLLRKYVNTYDNLAVLTFTTTFNKCVKKDLMGVVLKQYPENIAVKTKVSVHLYLKVL